MGDTIGGRWCAVLLVAAASACSDRSFGRGHGELVSAGEDESAWVRDEDDSDSGSDGSDGSPDTWSVVSSDDDGAPEGTGSDTGGEPDAPSLGGSYEGTWECIGGLISGTIDLVVDDVGALSGAIEGVLEGPVTGTVDDQGAIEIAIEPSFEGAYCTGVGAVDGNGVASGAARCSEDCEILWQAERVGG